MNRITTFCIFAACSLLAGTSMSGQTLTLTSPNGGETLTPGATYQITWSGTSDNDSTRLEYSTNGGATWSRIVKSVAGSSYAWKVPNTLSGHCLLRAVQVWSGKTGSAKDSVLMRENLSMSIDFSRDGKLIAIGDFSAGPITLRDGETTSVVGYLKGSLAGVSCLRFSPDGKYVGATEGDSYLRVWRVADSTLLYAVPIAFDQGTYLQFSPDSRRIAVGDGYFRVFDVATGSDVHLTQDTVLASCADFSRDGRYIVVGEETSVTVRDAGSGAVVKRLITQFKGFVRSVATNADGSRIAASDNSSVILFDGATGDTLYSIRPFKGSTADWLSFSADNSRLVVCRDGKVRIYDVETGDLLYAFTGGRSGAPSDAALSEDGTRLVVSRPEGTNYFYHLLSTDVSDNEFSIAVKGLSASAIDLGASKVGQEKDSTVTAFLSNQGATDVHVVGVSIVGKDSADFRLADLSVVPATLSPGGTLALRFAFTPSGTGQRTAKVTIVTESETLNVSITGTGLDTIAGVDAPSPGLSSEALRIMGCYPSPVRNEAHLRYAGRTAGTLGLTVTDAMGRVILERSDIASEPGEHEIVLDLSSVPSGMYAYKLRSAGQAAFGTMIVQH
jgi:WD40 repeat protein